MSMFLTFLVVFPQGLYQEGKPKPVITIPNKPESSCGKPKPVITQPNKPTKSTGGAVVETEESMGNRIVPGYLILLISLFCLAVVIR